MMKILMLASVAASLTLVSAAVQARANEADKSFLTQDVQGGRYELALAKFGATHATKPAIRRYAQMVAHDHLQANAALMRLVNTEGVNPPSGMTSKNDQMLAKLKTMGGSNFDRGFVDEMNRVNAEDQQSADQEKASTKDSAIKSYITRFAAMDAKHKQMAAQLRSALSSDRLTVAGHLAIRAQHPLAVATTMLLRVAA